MRIEEAGSLVYGNSIDARETESEECQVIGNICEYMKRHMEAFEGLLAVLWLISQTDEGERDSRLPLLQGWKA